MQSINPSALVALTLAVTHPLCHGPIPLDHHAVAVKVRRADLDMSAPAGVERAASTLNFG